MKPQCIFCDGVADTTINHNKTDCCKKCKEKMIEEEEKANEMSFENIQKMVLEMKSEPFVDRIKVDFKALQILKEFGQEVIERNSRVLPCPPPPTSVNVYRAGLPLHLDKTLKRGQWQAVDRNGNILEEGNLCPSI